MTEVVDWGARAHAAAAAHVAACDRAQECAEGQCEQHDPDKGEACPMPRTAGPYCSCTTCIIRETLHAAWPVLEQAAREGAMLTPLMWDRDAQPRADQVAEWLVRATEHERTAVVGRMQAAAGRGVDCFVRDHERMARDHRWIVDSLADEITRLRDRLAATA